MNAILTCEGAYLTKRFLPLHQQGGAHWSDATTFDKSKQIFSMLIMQKTWFKVEEFKSEGPNYLYYYFVTLRFWFEADLCPISTYIIFLRANISYRFSPVYQRIEASALEVKYYIFRNKDERICQKYLEWYSQHNIVALYPSSMSQTSCRWKKPLQWKNINTKHTHTCKQCKPEHWGQNK